MKQDIKIFLLDTNNQYGELDCEGLDLISDFSITEIQDITKRKDNLSKNIQLKGTKNNNRILGNAYNISKNVDSLSTQSLYSSFSINKKVECIVLENSILIMKGYFKVTNVKKSLSGDITYEALITGDIINFYSLFGDLNLTDLDFSEYEHEYTEQNIINSWSNTTGYTYPMINYGDEPATALINDIKVTNFRPALFLKTYMDKIFKLPELSGYTYEVKNLPHWDKLIIPNDQESFTKTEVGTIISLESSIQPKETTDRMYMLSFPRNFYDPQAIIRPNTSNRPFRGDTFNLYEWLRDLTSDMKITLYVDITTNHGYGTNCYLRLVERDIQDVSNDNLESFGTVEEYFLGTLTGENASIQKEVTFVVPKQTFKSNKQWGIMFYRDFSPLANYTRFRYGSAKLVTPSTPDSPVSYSIGLRDTIKPMPATAPIKDFIKSLTMLFNLYTYSSLDNPKHIVFESHDSFYSKCLPANVASNACDWSKRVDYSQETIISSITETAKQYTFSYKSDQDYYNTLYAENWKETYGSISTKNNTGNLESKKTEIIFSPTPLIQFSETGRYAPELYKLNTDGTKSQMKTNIRLLYYSGLQPCYPWRMGTYNLNGQFEPFQTQVPEIAGDKIHTSYPMCGHLLFSNDTTIADLNFGLPKQFFFPTNNQMIDRIKGAYEMYYEKQLDELFDINNFIYSIEAYLTPHDINTLDLRKPIFIQSEQGNSYFKIIKVEYSNMYEPSTLTLQKLII